MRFESILAVLTEREIRLGMQIAARAGARTRRASIPGVLDDLRGGVAILGEPYCPSMELMLGSDGHSTEGDVILDPTILLNGGRKLCIDCEAMQERYTRLLASQRLCEVHMCEAYKAHLFVKIPDPAAKTLAVMGYGPFFIDGIDVDQLQGAAVLSKLTEQRLERAKDDAKLMFAEFHRSIPVVDHLDWSRFQHGVQNAALALSEAYAAAIGEPSAIANSEWHWKVLQGDATP